MKSRFLFLIVCATAALLMAGCAAKRVTSKNIQQDSVSVEVRDRVEYITDTVEVAIPYIVERVTTRDTVSLLENDYAISEAIIEGEFLTHTLQTKPQLRQVQIKTPRLRRDSIVFRNIYRDVEVEVERDLTFVQKAKINSFWLFFIATIILSLVCWMRGRE
jgi:hypothetical protein